MKTSLLENYEVLLGVEEKWDSYYEVTVNFIEEVSIDAYTYYLFVDQNTKKHFYLRPRFVGDQIEDVLTKKVVVNLFSVDSDIYQSDKKQPNFYATGLLQLINKS
jgi:hypothetical protein